ncbi:hypothetical protein BC833DRAFT_597748 [Globomyces pollinis-pini]|nr:hypothetical protein BC833DRAFT_597748 [Globomyces pollinis-pini]
MRVVGLISGGKDSFFNLMHCLANGHEIVCLANLFPPRNIDELDSYMFQSVGHDMIDCYKECMQIPLYREEITGKSLETKSDYQIDYNDEVEDVFRLLSRIKADYPDVEGVASGAILSNYQRVRLEHVCKRLGLVSLAYLWQRNQSELLAEMIEFNMEAIVVKVAAFGLSQKHLGKTIEELEPHLLDTESKFGMNVCGEGGEFETITLDCPMFKKKLKIVDQEVVIHSDDMYAPVAYLKSKKVEIEDKSDSNNEWKQRLLQAGSDSFKSLIKRLDISNTIAPIDVPNPTTLLNTESKLGYQSYFDSRYFALSGINKHHCGRKDLTSLTDETKAVLDFIKSQLELVELGFHDVVLMSVFVRDLNQFTILNGAYKEYFGLNPPPRVTVQAHLDCELQIDVLAVHLDQFDIENKGHSKNTLHVQGISYWAPANIGPYSQACQILDHIYLAGMIGLTPNSMKLPAGEQAIHKQCQNSLNSLTNVADAMGANFPNHVIGCICYATTAEDLSVAEQYWKITNTEQHIPTLFIVVPKLPINALVEWQVTMSSILGHNSMLLKNPDQDPSSSMPQSVPNVQISLSNNNNNTKVTLKGLVSGEITTIMGIISGGNI